ncbi:cell cycle regulatory protein [Testicularia cyperi]|uniref:Cell cycle regulatory protein n=1 Tax=Testicularia cyperi TaxID=1882483 RepID=A0A317XFM7_9BASI|nr:cell cycle regulatory protein [Testicularia cyperi]
MTSHGRGCCAYAKRTGRDSAILVELDAAIPGSSRDSGSRSNHPPRSSSLTGMTGPSSPYNRGESSRSSISATGSSKSTSPSKKQLQGSYVDRFIPQRDGTDLQSAYQLISDEPATPHRHKRKITADMDAQKEEANQAFSSLLSSELFGTDAAANLSPSRGHRGAGFTNLASSSSSSVHTSGGSSATRHSSHTGLGSPATPTKKNLFSYSPSHSRTPGRSGSSTTRIADFGIANEELTPGGSRTGGKGLFGGLASSSHDSLDSPTHRAYSLSPVKIESQRMLLSPRKPPRVLSKVPYKVLDAPDLANDFYLNLVDWSNKNVLGVGLGTCVYLWSAENSSVTKLCDLKEHGNDAVTGLNWAGSGNHIAIGTEKGLVQIWDVEKQKLLRTMKGHTKRVGSLAWNEVILSSGSRDKLIYHRDVRAPDQYIRTLRAHRQEVCGLKWNTDINQLASGGNDNKLIVWDGLNETPLHRFTEHTAAVKALAWSPHQQGILASGGGTVDMKIRFWNTTTGSMLNEIDTGSQVCNLMWSKTANELISTHGYSGGTVQNQIQVWRYPSMQQIATLTGHTMRVLYLSMSPGGDTIVTGAGDETLRFWDLNNSTKSHQDKRREVNAFNPFAKLR